MCGIFFLNAAMCSKADAQRAFDTGARRGPTRSTLTYDKQLRSWVGFHRLAINGLLEAANQPMVVDGCSLLCNGEIYNHKELAAMLDIECASGSDCEVILHMYIKFGLEYTLSALDGVFALVIMDHRGTRTAVHLARDPFGVRPMYIVDTPDPDGTADARMLGVASELEPLQLAIAEGCHGAITQFPPGHSRTFEMRLCSTVGGPARLRFVTYEKSPLRRFFELPPVVLGACATDPSAIETNGMSVVCDALYAAVEKRVANTDRPVACLLSGGLDSSLVTALACKIAGAPLRTYSIGLPGSVDLENARLVAKHLGTDHRECILSSNAFIAAIPEVISRISSYDTTTVRASVGNYLIGQYIARLDEDVVVLNGDGADEVMGGYLYFRKAPDALSFDKECRRLVHDIAFFDVLRSDRCISSHGLEPRTPFLDKAFVSAYMSLPVKLRYDTTVNMQEKHLLRAAVAKRWPNLLPDSVLWRRKEAFSDGVSSLEEPWFQTIQTNIPTMDTDAVKGLTNEQAYYRYVFDAFYPGASDIVPYYWMPRFVHATDASARTLDMYDEDAHS